MPPHRSRTSSHRGLYRLLRAAMGILGLSNGAVLWHNLTIHPQQKVAVCFPRSRCSRDSAAVPDRSALRPSGRAQASPSPSCPINADWSGTGPGMYVSTLCIHDLIAKTRTDQYTLLPPSRPVTSPLLIDKVLRALGTRFKLSSGRCSSGELKVDVLKRLVAGSCITEFATARVDSGDDLHAASMLNSAQAADGRDATYVRVSLR